jgi:DNA-binding MarR family transcriptional regulator
MLSRMTEQTTPRQGRHDGGDLAAVLSRVRRALRRTTMRSGDIAEAQLEVLRLVRAEPGLRIQDAANSLGLAPNTVSTLAGRLVERGLLERQPDPMDRRGIRLALSDLARRRLAAQRDRRTQSVMDAFEALDPNDRAAIIRSLPALQRLAAKLEEPE